MTVGVRWAFNNQVGKESSPKSSGGWQHSYNYKLINNVLIARTWVFTQ